MSTRQMVFVMLKPVAFERLLVDKIITKFTEEGFRIICQRTITNPPRSFIEIQYPEEEFIRSKRLFSRDRIINYCASGPVMVMVLEAENAVWRMKELKGSPNPKLANPGTIRSWINDTIEEADAEGRALRDLIHSSDTEEETVIQARLWFGEGG